tara:strand:- start:416 stop:649 length:234 start_codon:yes stop_codon:yes gene_type:complete
MGRAIDQDNRLDDHERRLKLIEDALEEMIQTKVTNIDIHDELEKHERSLVEENNEYEFTPPAGKRKKATKKKTAKVE